MCTLAIVLPGCGDNPGPSAAIEAVVPASGTLTFQGRPLENFQVILTPTDGRRSAAGITNAEGKFTLGTNDEADGAPPGTHTVSVVWVGPLPSGADKAGQEVVVEDPNLLPQPSVRIPERYASIATSGLTQEIPAEGTDSLKIELK